MPRLMEVLEYLDPTGSVMVARVPPDGQGEIKWGAQLTVRESQNAAFFRDGRAIITFNRPGRYVLKTQNIPVLTKLVTRFGYGPQSPFRSEVYFLNMKLFRNLKWGTTEPVVFRDPDLEMIRLRSHGMFSIQISHPMVFLNRMVGTQGVFTDGDIHDYLKSIITSRLIDILGTNVRSIFELPKLYDELGAAAKAVLASDFEAAGLSLIDFFINSISPPDEVQAVIDERSSMKAIGDLSQYMRFKAAQSIQDAAQQTNGAAGTGVGLGAGVGMGMMLPQMLRNAFNTSQFQNTGQTNTGETDAPETEGPAAKIQKLKTLLDAGAISAEEFNRKKEELLKQI